MNTTHTCPNIQVIKKGFFRRAHEPRKVQRFFCKGCGKHFSKASFDPRYRQRKRHLNPTIMAYSCSLVSQRRLARLLQINRKSLVRRQSFLAKFAGLENAKDLVRLEGQVEHLQFDEMETFEHTKCKPLSLALAVSSPGRQILGFRVASMPAKGHLAAISRKKYGYRPDFRNRELAFLLQEVAPCLKKHAPVTSDQCPRYPYLVRKFLPLSKHTKVKGRRGCIVGQGELKKIGRDPLFCLNHTAAMARANIPRLIRKTWNTTKRADRLLEHLQIYTYYHNHFLLPKASKN